MRIEIADGGEPASEGAPEGSAVAERAGRAMQAYGFERARVAGK